MFMILLVIIHVDIMFFSAPLFLCKYMSYILLLVMDMLESTRALFLKIFKFNLCVNCGLTT